MELSGLKYLVVGSGFFGSVIAERLANDLNEKVLVIEKRPHLGGNSYSEIDKETSIEIHTYGCHIFHTDNKMVWDYIRNFTKFTQYRHRTFTMYKNMLYPMPINLETINLFYGKRLTPFEAKLFLQEEIAREAIANPANLEEMAISLVGRPLYEAFIKGYTIKQWQNDPRKLPANIITRLPFRFTYDNSYFNDPWQGIPMDGYTKIFEHLLANKNIEIRLNTDFFDIKEKIPTDCQVIYSGPLDRFFEYKFGVLGWRTLDFVWEVLPCQDFQGMAVMNFAEEEVKFTRIHEFKHYRPELESFRKETTIICRELSRTAAKNEQPFYPVNTSEDRTMLLKYQNEAANLRQYIFGGRLGAYKYYDMHQAIAEALKTYESLKLLAR